MIKTILVKPVEMHTYIELLTKTILVKLYTSECMNPQKTKSGQYMTKYNADDRSKRGYT